MEEAKQVRLTVPEVKFFLNALKKGNPDSVKHQKTLIAIFVNAIYLYDDKVTLIFNSGDKPVTVDADLLSKIEAAADSTPKAERFVYEQLSSTKKKKSPRRLFLFVLFTLHSSLFVLLSSLRSPPRLFPVKSEERKEKRIGSFAPQSTFS